MFPDRQCLPLGQYRVSKFKVSDTKAIASPALLSLCLWLDVRRKPFCTALHAGFLSITNTAESAPQ